MKNKSAKILLVDAPVTMEERYGRFHAFGSFLPPYGLLSIASVLKNNGYDVEIIESDSLEQGYDKLYSKICDANIPYIGISATTLSIRSAAQVARSIKNRFPQKHIIIGGCHVSAIPKETMSEFPDFDIAVIGEGEYAFLDLVRALESKDDLSSIDGIAFRRNGGIQLTKNRKMIRELDRIPLPAWEMLEGFPHRYLPAGHKVRRLPATHIITSRGCPNQCIFCDRTVFGSVYRYFSLEYLKGLFELLYSKFGIREISIEDDTFLIKKERVVGLCEWLISKKIALSWTCNGRVDSIDRDVLRLMKRAGCWQIGFGIESGNQNILSFIKKNVTLNQIREAVELTSKAGICTKGFFILGFPHETEETLQATINFAKSIKLDDITVSFMTPFPGSDFYKTAGAYGSFSKDWKQMNMLNVVFIPQNLTHDKLVFYHKKMIRAFYLRAPIIFKHIVFFALNIYFIQSVFKRIGILAKSGLRNKRR